MKRIAFGLIVLMASAVVLPLAAGDDDDGGMLARGYSLVPKAGHAKELEAGLMQQVAWYKANNETWHWHTWQWETGENFGDYLFRSPGHHWADMDERAERSAKAREHFVEVVGPHLESMSASISEVLPRVSHWPDDLGVVPMVSAYGFKLHYGMTEEFMHTIAKIHEAIVESQWPINYAWIVTVSGGEMPFFWLVVPHKSWADMKGPEKPFKAMLEETIGRQDAETLMASLRACVREEHSALARLRPELSYMPEE